MKFFNATFYGGISVMATSKGMFEIEICIEAKVAKIEADNHMIRYIRDIKSLLKQKGVI